MNKTDSMIFIYTGLTIFCKNRQAIRALGMIIKEG